jgi:threonine/homoserine/homoserine lactone efflux protein
VLTSFALIVVPGPSVLFVITRALILGRRGAFTTVFGNAIGEFVQVMAVALGIGVIVERSIDVFTVLKPLGAAYLIYLGVQAIRHHVGQPVGDHRRIGRTWFERSPKRQSNLGAAPAGWS